MTSTTPDPIHDELGPAARAAARQLATASREARDAALRKAADRIRSDAARLLQANEQDLAAARERGISGAMLDRLTLDDDRIEAIAAGLEAIADLPDPVGHELARFQPANGLDITRIAVPIGVIGVIYESRPNVTADAAALCLKSGNAVILRGGSEAVHSNRAIHRAIHDALEESELPAACVQMIPDQDRALVGSLLQAHEHVDVIVPRGGKSLVERVQKDARVPVFAHLDGNNHLYWHCTADPAMAIDVITNAKLRRPGICGALETLLVDRGALEHLPRLVDVLSERGCELRGDERARAADDRIGEATEADWDTEYLAPVLAIAVVDNPAEAMAHIARHGSGHTDGILAGDDAVAERFLTEVDSAIVMRNASTQFADGGEFGFGAEIGIATGRLHARGPVGLEQLTTFKYQVRGTGQTRA
jgi:glutamate-5-semialdehyde dehydrogenase